jgi:hypothetical protein
MGNIERRLSRLERQTGGSVCFVVIRPGETQDQAKERYFAEFPERRSARLVFIRIKGDADEERGEEKEMSEPSSQKP